MKFMLSIFPALHLYGTLILCLILVEELSNLFGWEGSVFWILGIWIAALSCLFSFLGRKAPKALPVVLSFVVAYLGVEFLFDTGFVINAAIAFFQLVNSPFLYFVFVGLTQVLGLH